MERIKQITIAGKEYLLNFSTRAAKAVMERYGDLNVNNALFAQPSGESGETEQRSIADIADETAWLLSLLMQEGAAYARVVEQREVSALTVDELQTVLSAMELMDARVQILEAVGAGLSASVEVEPDTKNAETTQSN